MSEWTPERITQQQRLAFAGRAGVWIFLEGGPRNGTRGFIPHVDWPFFIVIDAEGASWSFASPPGITPASAGARIVGIYVFDDDRETMTWRGAVTRRFTPST